MSLESGPNNQNVQRPIEEILLNLDPRTGKHWYVDKDRRVVELNDEQDSERDRRQLDPTSEPAPGHAKYSSSISIAEMPAAPGEIVPMAIEPQQGGENRAPVDFKMHYSHNGTLKGYRRILLDGTYEKNPDGTNRLFTENEVKEERAKAVNAKREEPSNASVHAPTLSTVEKVNDDSSGNNAEDGHPAAGGLRHQAPPVWRRGPGPALTDAERADNSYVHSTTPEPFVTPGTPIQQGEDMPALPGFYRARDKAAIVNRVLAGAPPTLDVILQNPKTQELFGEFLKINKKSDLISKFNENAAAMSLEDQEKLHALRLEFGTRLALADEAAAYLTQEDVTMMLKNPNFGLFADTLRPERAMKVIQERGIPLMFMRENSTTINRMILTQRSLQGIRSGPRRKYYQNLRERVMRRAGTNVAPEHLDPNVMRHVLRKSVLESLSIFGGPNDGHTSTLNSITHNIALVSNILSSSVSADPNILLDAAREAQTGNEMSGIGTVENSYKEMKRAEGSYKLAEEQRAFKGFRQRLRDRGIDTENLSADDETSYFNDFQHEREAVHGRGERRRGWFSTLLDAFFSAFFASNRNEFKFKEA